MDQVLDYLFGAASFVPHGYCLLWRPDLVALHAVSDLLIALAYFSIPVALWYVVRQRPNFQYRRLFLLFATFILFCGLTHIIAVLTLWAPIYGIQGLVKAATAGVSLLAAYSLWPALPNALAIPAFDDLRQDNQKVGQAIFERDELISGLSAANRDLEDFAYTVAHDLRSPLRSINGHSQMLIDDYAGQLDENGREMLQRVRSSTLNMSRLIDDLLFLSQIRQMPLKKSDIDLSEMARSLIAELRREEPDREVSVSVQDGAVAQCDPELMRIALTHLLQNAWKFTSEKAGAIIAITWEKDADRIRLHIRDNGAGFDMSYVNKLFLPFQRLHAVEEFGGNGIGLAIVSRIIARHGGTVTADAQVGKGAEFTMII